MSDNQVGSGAAKSVREMLAKGYTIGIGESAVLGWFKPGKSEGGVPSWIPWSSLSPEERAWVFGNKVSITQAELGKKAETYLPGTLYATVTIVSSPAA